MPLCDVWMEATQNSLPVRVTAYCGEEEFVPTWDQSQLSNREREHLHTHPIDFFVKMGQFTLIPRREKHLIWGHILQKSTEVFHIWPKRHTISNINQCVVKNSRLRIDQDQVCAIFRDSRPVLRL